MKYCPLNVKKIQQGEKKMPGKTRSTFSVVVNFLLLLTFLVLPLYFVACSDDDEDDDSSAAFDPYFPMNQGNIWDFVVQGQDDVGTGQAEVLENVSFNSYSAVPVEFSETSGIGLGNGTVYQLVTADTVDILGGYNDDLTITLDTPLRLYQFPLAVGNSWNSATSLTFDIFPIKVTMSTKVEAQEDITVQGKKYTDAFRLLSDVTVTYTIVIPITVEGTVTSWLARDVGPIKTVADIPDLPLELLAGGTYSVEVTGTNFN